MTGQPSPNRRTLSILLGAAIGSACVWVVPPAGADPPLPPKPPPPKATVGYSLTGSGIAAYVTYQIHNGQAHATNVALPWSVGLTGNVIPYSLSAQGAGPGALTCAITVDNKVVSQNTATGNPARVVCEHHGPPITE